eukprot:jgi/Chlat1/7482/Chrsp60S06997
MATAFLEQYRPNGATGPTNRNCTAMWLDGAQLSGPLPSTLGNLTNLQFLSVGSNQLSGQLPSTLGNLVNLIWLYINDNQFSGPLPSTLGNLAKIYYL